MPSDTRYLKSADSAFKPSSAKGRKDGRHTVKVQYTVNTNGLIVHSTRHFPGRVHDVKVYRMKHPTLPSGLPSRDGSDGKEEKARVLCSIFGVFHHFHEGVQLGRRGVKLGSWPDHACMSFNLRGFSLSSSRSIRALGC